MEEKRRVGRPRTRTEETTGDYVGFRAPRELKERLEAAAGASGRSLSTETQFRLENSFREEQLIAAALDPSGRATAFLHLISRAIHEAAQIAVDPDTGGDWLDQQPAFEAVKRSVERLFEAFEPPSQPSDDLSLVELKIGDHTSADLLDALVDPAGAVRKLGPWARPLAAKLGPELVERIRTAERGQK